MTLEEVYEAKIHRCFQMSSKKLEGGHTASSPKFYTWAFFPYCCFHDMAYFLQKSLSSEIMLREYTTSALTFHFPPFECSGIFPFMFP